MQHAFEQDQITGLQAARLLGKLTDGADRARCTSTPLPDHRLGEPEASAVAATGGYGRGVLAPFSDIDLLFLTPERPDPARRCRSVEYMLYFLWDLGLKVGHATRSIDGMPGRGRQGHHDPHRAARCPPCSPATPTLFGDVPRRFRAACKEAGAAGYIAAKQAERAARHRRYGDSPFVVEPNIKEGRGGLRDLQTLYWIARYVFGTPHRWAELAEVGGVLTPQRGAARPPRLGLPVDRALPPALRRRPRRGTPDLRPAAGGRRPHGLHPPRPAGRRRALHAPLFPDRARGRRG